MLSERRPSSLFYRLTSAVVIGTLVAACNGKTFGYTPTPEASHTPTPTAEPYCDSHMLVVQPDLNLDAIDPQELPFFAENLMAPSGIGRIEGISKVTNPKPSFTEKVKLSAKQQKLDIDLEKATVVEFGMNGSSSPSCAPLPMILGEVAEDGTQKAYIGLAENPIDADGNGETDLVALGPPYGGEVDVFLELGQVKSSPNDETVQIGVIDQLDPETINPLFSVNQETGQVYFYPPFYDGEEDLPPKVSFNDDGTFEEVSASLTSFDATTQITQTPVPATKTPPSTKTPEPTPTKEVIQYPKTTIENYTSGEPVPVDDLFNGKYYDFLQTISLPFDSTKVNPQLTCTPQGTDILISGVDSFKDLETSPLKRGLIINYTMSEYIANDGDATDLKPWIILPVEFYNPNDPSKPIWVTFVSYKSSSWNDNQWLELYLKPWTKSSKFLVGTISTFNSNPDSLPNALVTRSFNMYPDMKTRLKKFEQTCDPSYISGPGILLTSGALQK